MRRRIIGALAAALFSAAVLAQVQGPGLTVPVPVPDEPPDAQGPVWGLRGALGGMLDGQRGLAAGEHVLSSPMLLADWYPLASYGFRVSGGLAVGGLRDSTLVRDADLDRALRNWSSGGAPALDPWSWIARGNPYLGLGWESGGAIPRSGLYFSADLGVMYQRNGVAGWGCTAAIPAVLCTPDARLDVIGDELRFAPVMSLGVGLRF